MFDAQINTYTIQIARNKYIFQRVYCESSKTIYRNTKVVKQSIVLEWLTKSWGSILNITENY